MECKFAFEDEVTVTRGFFKGRKGTVLEVRESKDVMEYSVRLDGIKNTQWLPESDLVKFKKGFLQNFDGFKV